MLIGLDAIPLTEPLSGVGRYTLELARALAAASPADDFELVYPARYPPITIAEDDGEPAGGGGGSFPPNLKLARVRAGLLGRRWWLVGLPRQLKRRRRALFHGTNYEVPLRAACPTVLTVHDLSAFTHGETQLPRRARRLRRRLPLMARAATHVITPTEAVRREACEILKLDAAKVTAVHEAPRAVFRPLARERAAGVLRRLGVAGDFLLAVGTIEPRKNLTTLVAAFERVALSRPLTLVVAGREGWLVETLRARVESSPARERVRFTGHLPDETLRALYSSCLAFVYPSLYEGFGLPPLEAAACGAAVVASRIPPLEETLGERGALLFDADDADGLARALHDLCDDESLRGRLALAGRQRAAEFTWERAARETLAVYARALGAGSRVDVD
ncbi:MAG: glycosyltransferase family 4 protein [Acidobacteria bacterium]|nr:glycosyltransferase family 4 protein [Acidobacteriota bacterium]